jgi:arylsulfatase A-like enzyme
MRLYDGIYGRALVSEQFKLLIPEHSQIPELYDLKNDPYEKMNVIDKFPLIAEAMLKELAAWQKSCTDSQNGKDYAY